MKRLLQWIRLLLTGKADFLGASKILDYSGQGR